MYVKLNGKKVFAPFFKYGADKKTWPTKEAFEKEFNEFRWNAKNKNHSIAFAKEQWFQKHLNKIDYKIYLKRKHKAYNLKLKRTISRIRNPIKPKRH